MPVPPCGRRHVEPNTPGEGAYEDGGDEDRVAAEDGVVEDLRAGSCVWAGGRTQSKRMGGAEGVGIQSEEERVMSDRNGTRQRQRFRRDLCKLQIKGINTHSSHYCRSSLRMAVHALLDA